MFIAVLWLVLSALLTAAAFPPCGYFYLAFAGMMPLFYVLSKTRRLAVVLLYAALYALVFYACILSGGLALSAYVPLGWVLLLGAVVALTQSLYAVLALGLGWLLQQNPLRAGFAAPILAACGYAFAWIILDWLRSLGAFGLTLGGLAYAQYLFTDFIQLARYTGPYGLVWVIVFVNALGGILAARFRTAKQTERWAWVWVVVVLLLVFCSGLYLSSLSLQFGEERKPESKQVAIFQPAIPQEDKLSADTDALKAVYLENIRAYSQTRRPDLLVLPETIVAEYLLEHREFMFALRDALDFSLVFGTPRRLKKDGQFFLYNAVVLLNRYGVVTPLHDKKYLVPFGEYLPFRFLLGRLFARLGYLDVEYSPGQENQPVADYAVSLCFESTFPYQAREQILQGGRLLFVLTNDAWFGRGALLDMHLACAVLRAVENNRYVLQAANTGRSAVIDNRGRILAMSALDKPEWLEAEVQMRADRTLYTYLGEIAVYLAFVFLALYLYLWLRSR